MDAGNGSLMRILPLTFYLDAKYGYPFAERAEAMEVIRDVSSLTHAHIRCVIACGIYCAVAQELLHGAAIRTAVNDGLHRAGAYFRGITRYWAEEMDGNFQYDFASLSQREEELSGSG